MFRYWDGQAWSAALSPTPTAAPPSQGLGQPTASQPGTPSYDPRSQPSGQQQSWPGQPPQQSGGQFGTTPYGAHQQAYGPYPGYPAAPQNRSGRHRRAVGWWIGGGVLAVVIILVGVFAIRSLTGDTVKNNADPGSDSTKNSCPTSSQSPTAAPKRHADDRVHGGPVSYPRLSSPWGMPQTDNRVPFGSNVKEQDITIEQSYQPGKSWVASVLIGQLQAGDGFFTPKQGSKIVAKCIASGEFYGNHKVKRSDQKSKATKVDGHKAWYLKSHLSFNIKGLKAKGETMIIVIVKSGKSSNGLYYASIPDNAKQYLPTAEKLISKLKISS